MATNYNTSIDMLIHVFGTHHGNCFYHMNTPIHSEIIPIVIDLVESGEYSPYEIDQIIREKYIN